MKPTRTLAPAAAFFFEHAGYSYDPKTETPEEGRTTCAESLASAEAAYLEAHQLADVACTWGPDSDGAVDWRRENRGRKDAPEIEACAIHDADGNCLASLWGIQDADTNYRRVVRAELAAECLDELRALVERANA